MSPATLALDSAGVAGATGPATITYNSAPTGTGTVGVSASFNSTVIGQGSVNVQVSSPATATVAATGTQPNVVAPGAAATQTFTVTNTGATAAFTFSHNCATMAPAAATACSASSPAQPTTITGGASTTVTVSFTGSTTKGIQGTLTLQALVSAVVAGSGNATIAIPNATATNPGAVTLATNTSGSAVFTVTNTGTTTASYSLTSLCAGPVTGCGTPSPATLTLAPSIGGSTTVAYTTAATAGSGTVTLQVRYPNATGTILTTGVQNVTVQAATAIVAATGTQPNVVAPGAAATQTFTVTNTGATAAFTFSHNCATMGAGGCHGVFS